MKRISIVCLLFLLASVVYAMDEIFLGFGAEANANTREGAAAGGGLVLGYEFENRSFAFGVRAVYSKNFGTVSNIESAAFFRWYPLVGGLFMQAELGASIFFEFDNVFPVPLYGLAAGWRFEPGETFFIEPWVKGGYPFIWGAGLIMGIRIPNIKGEKS